MSGGSTLDVEHLFTLVADVERAATIDAGPHGRRVVVNCTGGTFEGPRLRGRVLSPSGDWVRVEADGLMRIDVRLLLRTDDDADILMTYTGVAHDGGRSIRAVPTFVAGAGPYAWLNAVQAVAVGASASGRVTYEVYRLR